MYHEHPLTLGSERHQQPHELRNRRYILSYLTILAMTSLNPRSSKPILVGLSPLICQNVNAQIRVGNRNIELDTAYRYSVRASQQIRCEVGAPKKRKAIPVYVNLKKLKRNQYEVWFFGRANVRIMLFRGLLIRFYLRNLNILKRFQRN